MFGNKFQEFEQQCTRQDSQMEKIRPNNAKKPSSTKALFLTLNLYFLKVERNFFPTSRL